MVISSKNIWSTKSEQRNTRIKITIKANKKSSHVEIERHEIKASKKNRIRKRLGDQRWK